MGDLTTYSLSDFILFSGKTYYRMFELYNQAYWPVHILAFCFTVFILVSASKKISWAERFITGILILSLLWVAWSFLYQYFYQIHVIANWYTLIYSIEAGLLAWYGFIKNQLLFKPVNKFQYWSGLSLLVVSLLFYPFIPFLYERPWMQFEMFGLSPDPTMLATLGILLIFSAPVILYIIPLVWMIISFITHVAM